MCQTCAAHAAQRQSKPGQSKPATSKPSTKK